MTTAASINDSSFNILDDVKQDKNNKQQPCLETNSEEKVKQDDGLPPGVQKTICFAITLFVLGVCCIIGGFVFKMFTSNSGAWLSMLIIGIILIIPGGYYTFIYIKLRTTDDNEQREEIISEIPDIN